MILARLIFLISTGDIHTQKNNLCSEFFRVHRGRMHMTVLYFSKSCPLKFRLPLDGKHISPPFLFVTSITCILMSQFY